MKLDVESRQAIYVKGLYGLAVLFNGFYIVHYNLVLGIKQFNFFLIPIWLFLLITPPAIFYFTRNFVVSVWTLMLGAFGILVAFMWTAGGLMAPSALWLTAIPLAMGLVLGAPGVFGGALFSSVIFLGFITYSSFAPQVPEIQKDYLIHKTTNLVVYFGFLMGTLYIHRHQEQREKQVIIDESENTASLFKVLLHDVGNDLNSIFATVERFKYDPQKEINIENIEKRLNNLVNLIDQLRQLKEFKEGAELVNTTALPVNVLLKEAHDHCQEAASVKDVKIQFELSPEDLFVRGEESLFLHTILLNFLSNAVKFSHPQGVVTVRSYMTDNKVNIDIEDSGIGIPLELQHQIFHVKKSVSRPGTQGEKGSGYGLALARRYVEMHKGTLNIVSLPVRQGTLVTLSFPPFSTEEQKTQPV